MPKPGVCVMVAGFQNIEDKAPPAAAPAKASPCPTVPCSCMPNAPAFASIGAIGMRTVALANSVAQPDLSVFAPMFAPALSDLERFNFAASDLFTPVVIMGMKWATAAMALNEKSQLRRKVD
jgi:hypothetical protein